MQALVLLNLIRSTASRRRHGKRAVWRQKSAELALFLLSGCARGPRWRGEGEGKGGRLGPTRLGVGVGLGRGLPS